MTTLRQFLPTGRRLLVLDVLLVVWAGAWIAFGVVTVVEVRGLRATGDTVTRVGQAVKRTGDALDAVAALPLVGGSIGPIADEVQAAGRSALDSGEASESSARRLSWILGLGIALLPSVPLLGFYLPIRLGAARERRDLLRLLHSGMGVPALQRALADRALRTLPYGLLLDVAGDPWAEYAAGRHGALAAAELDRAGIPRADRGPLASASAPRPTPTPPPPAGPGPPPSPSPSPPSERGGAPSSSDP